MMVGPTPRYPPHPMLSKRPLPSKRARTLGPSESSKSRPQKHPSSPPQGLISDIPQDESLGSIIRRPILHYGPILGNSDYSGKDMCNEYFYDFPAFASLPELRGTMRLMQRYSLEPFMTSRRFFYPQGIIEFYQSMTSKRDPNHTALHFSIDG